VFYFYSNYFDWSIKRFSLSLKDVFVWSFAMNWGALSLRSFIVCLFFLINFSKSTFGGFLLPFFTYDLKVTNESIWSKMNHIFIQIIDRYYKFFQHVDNFCIRGLIVLVKIFNTSIELYIFTSNFTNFQVWFNLRDKFYKWFYKFECHESNQSLINLTICFVSILTIFDHF